MLNNTYSQISNSSCCELLRGKNWRTRHHSTHRLVRDPRTMRHITILDNIDNTFSPLQGCSFWEFWLLGMCSYFIFVSASYSSECRSCRSFPSPKSPCKVRCCGTGGGNRGLKLVQSLKDCHGGSRTISLSQARYPHFPNVMTQ